MLLLHLGFDRLAHVLENHSQFPVWARGTRLGLAANKIF